MKQRLPISLKKQAGQAIVEFALATLIMIPMIFGTIDIGTYFWAQTTLDNAARAGARYAIVHGSQSQNPCGPGNTAPIVQVVNNSIAALPNPGSITVNASWDPNNSPGSSVTVQVTYTWQPFTFVVWNGTLTINSNATMTIQH